MALVPQIRLRTFFFIFVCAAVGLTVGTRWDPQRQQWSPALRWYRLRLDWHYACLAAASVAIIFGLLQDVRRLRASSFREHCDADALQFSRTFSIAWRLICAIMIVVCLVATLLISSQFVEIPESETLFTYDLFPFIVWTCCIIAVLLTSLRRWRPIGSKRPLSVWHALIGVLAAFLLLLYLLPELGLIHHLIHVATNSIENAQPAVYHRPGEFPDHRAEGFRLFWISLVASGSVFFAAACLIMMNNAYLHQGHAAAIFAIGFAVAVAVAATYSAWFYASEFHRVSPYVAGAGYASNRLEQVVGAVLALLLATTGAYCLTLRDEPSATVGVQPMAVSNGPAIYESTLCLLVLSIAAAIYVFEAVRVYSSASFWQLTRNGVLRIVETVASLCHDPASLLMILIGATTAQLCWLRWRRRGEQIEWRIGILGRRQFAWNFAALGILMIVSIPTLSSFCFVCWLGPWYLYGD